MSFDRLSVTRSLVFVTVVLSFIIEFVERTLVSKYEQCKQWGGDGGKQMGGGQVRSAIAGQRGGISFSQSSSSIFIYFAFYTLRKIAFPKNSRIHHRHYNYDNEVLLASTSI